MTQMEITEQQEFIFKSPLPDIILPNHLPLHTYIFQNISQFRSRPCLINSATGETLTYDDVEVATKKVATGFRNKLGIQKGDVIMILLHNSPEFVYSFLGASSCGAISTTANPLYTIQEIGKQAKGSRAKVIITHECYVEKVKAFAQENELKIVCVDESTPEGCFSFSELQEVDEDEVDDPQDVKINPSEDLVALPYSSGTTGLPKGVMLTHKNLVSSVSVLVDGDNPNMNFHKEDSIMCVLPLFHIYCLNSVFLTSLRVGAALVIMPKFDINNCMELVEKYKVTIAPFVPPILLAIAKSELADKYDLSSIRMVQSGGAPLGKELEDAIRTKLPNAVLGQGCGMTEAGPLAMCPMFAKEPISEAKSGSCGKVVRNIEIKIVDIETGASLPHNQSGEICLRGDQVMKGYLDDPENTAKAIDKEGWMHSGDIGYVDDDGDLFIVDRLKEIIKYKGFQVAPAELESLLVAHPNISEAVVVPMNDEAAGEVPVAFVVKIKGSQVTEEEIKNYIAQQVIYYKKIKRVFFIDAIPKAASGKLLRKEVRTKLLAGLA